MTPDSDLFATRPQGSNDADTDTGGPQETNTGHVPKVGYVDGATVTGLSDDRRIARTRKKIADGILVGIVIFVGNLTAQMATSPGTTIAMLLFGALLGLFPAGICYLAIVRLASERKTDF